MSHRLSVLVALWGCAPAGPITLPSARTDAGMLALLPHEEGRWTTQPETMAINPIHAVLLNETVTRAERETPGARVGTILVVSGSGDDEGFTELSSEVHDLSAGTVESIPMPFDAFCSGITVLPDGNPFVVGGNRYDNGLTEGIRTIGVFDVAARAYRARPDMAGERWYPTATHLGDGRVMVSGGWGEYTVMNETVEIWTPGAGWSDAYPMGFRPMFYPRLHVLPDGRVFRSGPENDGKMFDPDVVSLTNTGWTHVDWTNFASTPGQWNREYGSSVLLPLDPADGYTPRVMILGGFRTTPTATTELIDLSDPSPEWVWGPDMSGPRVRMNAVLLPDGEVLALGGSSVDTNEPDATLTADLYDPVTDTMSPAGTMEYPHLDHSVALLLPDGTVWVTGSQYEIPDYEEHVEIYEPPYLFEADGSYRARPVIDQAPRTIAYGAPFVVRTDEAADIDRVVLMKPGAVTHSFDTDQRQVGLEFVRRPAQGALRVTAPPDANVAPAGYYMLFLLDADGTPSVATFVRLQ